MFDLITVVVIGIFMYFGLRNGLVKAAIKLIGFTLAAWAASQYYAAGGKLIARLFDISEGVQAVVGFVFVFIAFFLFFELIGAMLKSLMRKLKLVWVDRAGGVLFGFLEGVVLMSVVVWIINVYPELGFVGRLQKSSTAFQLLSRFEHKAVRIGGLQPKLNGLSRNLRKAVYLPETPAADADSTGLTPVISIP